MKKIIIAGGSGYIGQAFYQKYKKKYDIKILSRSFSSKKNYITALEACDVLINLAGEKIFPNRWTAKRREILINSRVEYSKKLLNKAKSLNINHYIQASAVTFYPFSENEIYTEDNSSIDGNNFSLELVKNWELQVKSSPIKNNSILRIGVVIGKNSSFLEPMKHLFKFGLGGMIGNGKQWISWIHIDDMVDIINFTIEKNINGPINVTSPNALTNEKMSQLIAKNLARPSFFHMPRSFYKILFGEASELLTEGHQIYPKLLIDKGYKFKFLFFDEAFKSSI